MQVAAVLALAGVVLGAAHLDHVVAGPLDRDEPRGVAAQLERRARRRDRPRDQRVQRHGRADGGVVVGGLDRGSARRRRRLRRGGLGRLDQRRLVGRERQLGQREHAQAQLLAPVRDRDVGAGAALDQGQGPVELRGGRDLHGELDVVLEVLPAQHRVLDPRDGRGPGGLLGRAGLGERGAEREALEPRDRAGPVQHGVEVAQLHAHAHAVAGLHALRGRDPAGRVARGGARDRVVHPGAVLVLDEPERERLAEPQVAGGAPELDLPPGLVLGQPAGRLGYGVRERQHDVGAGARVERGRDPQPVLLLPALAGRDLLAGRQRVGRGRVVDHLDRVREGRAGQLRLEPVAGRRARGLEHDRDRLVEPERLVPVPFHLLAAAGPQHEAALEQADPGLLGDLDRELGRGRRGGGPRARRGRGGALRRRRERRQPQQVLQLELRGVVVRGRGRDQRGGRRRRLLDRDRHVAVVGVAVAPARDRERRHVHRRVERGPRELHLDAAGRRPDVTARELHAQLDLLADRERGRVGRGLLAADLAGARRLGAGRGRDGVVVGGDRRRGELDVRLGAGGELEPVLLGAHLEAARALGQLDAREELTGRDLGGRAAAGRRAPRVRLPGHVDLRRLGRDRGDRDPRLVVARARPARLPLVGRDHERAGGLGVRRGLDDLHPELHELADHEVVDLVLLPAVVHEQVRVEAQVARGADVHLDLVGLGRRALGVEPRGRDQLELGLPLRGDGPEHDLGLAGLPGLAHPHREPAPTLRVVRHGLGALAGVEQGAHHPADLDPGVASLVRRLLAVLVELLALGLGELERVLELDRDAHLGAGVVGRLGAQLLRAVAQLGVMERGLVRLVHPQGVGVGLAELVGVGLGQLELDLRLLEVRGEAMRGSPLLRAGLDLDLLLLAPHDRVADVHPRRLRGGRGRRVLGGLGHRRVGPHHEGHVLADGEVARVGLDPALGGEGERQLLPDRDRHLVGGRVDQEVARDLLELDVIRHVLDVGADLERDLVGGVPVGPDHVLLLAPLERLAAQAHAQLLLGRVRAHQVERHLGPGQPAPLGGLPARGQGGPVVLQADLGVEGLHADAGAPAQLAPFDHGERQVDLATRLGAHQLDRHLVGARVVRLDREAGRALDRRALHLHLAAALRDGAGQELEHHLGLADLVAVRLVGRALRPARPVDRLARELQLGRGGDVGADPAHAQGDPGPHRRGELHHDLGAPLGDELARDHLVVGQEEVVVLIPQVAAHPHGDALAGPAAPQRELDRDRLAHAEVGLLAGELDRDLVRHRAPFSPSSRPAAAARAARAPRGRPA